MRRRTGGFKTRSDWRLADCAGRRVGVWGYGREGAAAVRLLRSLAPPAALTVVTDDPLPVQSAADLRQMGPSVAAVHGPTGLPELMGCDVVIRSPGISRYRDDHAALAAEGVILTTGTDLWLAEHANDTVVAVTGTKGKSTTTALIGHLIRSAGRQVVVAGNIGLPLLDIFDIQAKVDAYVIEISSYQASDVTHSPTIGVLLNLHPEHADWHGSKEQYFADKLNLFRHNDATIVVANHGDAEVRRRLSSGLPSGRVSERSRGLSSERSTGRPPADRVTRQVVWFGDCAGFHVADDQIRRGQKVVCAERDLQLRGAHNLLNACAALTVADLLDVPAAAWPDALTSFAPLPHRLEAVLVRGSVTYINDSISTIPESTMAAILAFAPAPMTVIIGGHDRGQDYAKLARFIAPLDYVTSVIGIPETGGRALAAIAAAAESQPRTGRPLTTVMAKTMDDAVAQATRLTPPGGTVLLSPAAPSYGQFRNFEERGIAFRAAAERLR